MMRFGKPPTRAVNLAMIGDASNSLQTAHEISLGKIMSVSYPIVALIAYFTANKPSLINSLEKLPISPYSKLDQFNKTGFFSRQCQNEYRFLDFRLVGMSFIIFVSFLLSERWQRIQKQLDDIEGKYKVAIVYAAEISSKAVPPDFLDSNYCIRFVYTIRGNVDRPLKRPRDQSFILLSVDNNRLEFDGQELSEAVRYAQQLDTDTLNSLYSPIVYRDSDIGPKYGEQMREFLQNQVKTSQFFKKLLDSLESSYKYSISGSDRVFIGSYISLIRNALQLSWLMLYSVDTTEETTLRRPHKLVEIHAEDILQELHACGQIDDQVFKAIRDLFKNAKTMNSFDFTDRSEAIDEWMMQTIFAASEAFKKLSVTENANFIFSGLWFGNPTSTPEPSLQSF